VRSTLRARGPTSNSETTEPGLVPPLLIISVVQGPPGPGLSGRRFKIFFIRDTQSLETNDESLGRHARRVHTQQCGFRDRAWSLARLSAMVSDSVLI